MLPVGALDNIADSVKNGANLTRADYDELAEIFETAGKNLDDVIGGTAGEVYNGVRKQELDFFNGKNSTMSGHFGRPDHGNFSSPDEYLAAARNFVEKQPTTTTKSFISADGTYFRYDTATNEFGLINEFGGISTYFFQKKE